MTITKTLVIRLADLGLSPLGPESTVAVPEVSVGYDREVLVDGSWVPAVPKVLDSVGDEMRVQVIANDDPGITKGADFGIKVTARLSPTRGMHGSETTHTRTVIIDSAKPDEVMLADLADAVPVPAELPLVDMERVLAEARLSTTQVRAMQNTVAASDAKADQALATARATIAPTDTQVATLAKDASSQTRAALIAAIAAGAVNVRHRGAKGDGSDDTTTIQASCDAAASLGIRTVYVPAGTYGLKAPIQVPRSVSLLLDPGATLKALAATASLVRFTATDGTGDNGPRDQSISGGVLDGNFFADNGLVLGDFQGFTVSDLTIKNTLKGGFVTWSHQTGHDLSVSALRIDRDRGNAAPTGSRGIQLEGISDSYFSDVVIKGAETGWWNNGCPSVHAIMVHVWNFEPDGLHKTSFYSAHSEGVTFTLCDADTPSKVGWELTGGQGITLNACRLFLNTFAASGTGGIYVSNTAEYAPDLSITAMTYRVSQGKTLAYDIDGPTIAGGGLTKTQISVTGTRYEGDIAATNLVKRNVLGEVLTGQLVAGHPGSTGADNQTVRVFGGWVKPASLPVQPPSSTRVEYLRPNPATGLIERWDWNGDSWNSPDADTGWIDMSGRLGAGWTVQSIFVRRIGHRVTWRIEGLDGTNATTAKAVNAPVAGFANASSWNNTLHVLWNENDQPIQVYVGNDASIVIGGNQVTKRGQWQLIEYLTDQPWPTGL